MTAGLLDGDSFSMLTHVIKFSYCLKGTVHVFDIRCFLRSKIHAWVITQSTDHLSACQRQFKKILNRKPLSKMSFYLQENNVFMYLNVEPPLEIFSTALPPPKRRAD